MDKFIKGPWYANNCTVYRHEDAGAIAYTGARFDIFGKGLEECHANARLIAAAPEMLSALRETLHALLPYDKDGNMSKVVELVNAIIEKATAQQAGEK